MTVLKGCFLNIRYFSSALLGKRERFKPLNVKLSINECKVIVRKLVNKSY